MYIQATCIDFAAQRHPNTVLLNIDGDLIIHAGDDNILTFWSGADEAHYDADNLSVVRYDFIMLYGRKFDFISI